MSDSTEERLHRLEQLAISMGNVMTGQRDEIEELRGRVNRLTEAADEAKALARGAAVLATAS
jgi:hypothetical protein